MNASKQKGTAAETAVKRFAIGAGFKGAERLALRGTLDVGDVRLCKDLHIEVKSGAQAANPTNRQLLRWLEEADREALNQGPGCECFLVTKRTGAASAELWPVHMTLNQLSTMTRDWICDTLGQYRVPEQGPPPRPGTSAGGSLVRMEFGTFCDIQADLHKGAEGVEDVH